MPRWFLSYHSPDEALAKGLKAAIERNDSDAHVFFAPAYLRAGSFWQRALAEELAQADAFILLVGESGVGNWQELEYQVALDRRVTGEFPLVLVLLEDQTAPGLFGLRQLHWIVTPDPTSEKDVGRLIEALETGEGSTPSELWRFTSPYRGLAAMEEKDSDYFFGRERETGEVLDALAGAPDKLPVIIGNSGVGKSSLAQAGVLAALKRQARPGEESGKTTWPQVFNDSRQWCFLALKPGSEPLKALVQAFLDTWQFDTTDVERVKRQNDWTELLLHDERTRLGDLLDATERRYKERNLSEPPAFFLYIDQGEELYVRGEKSQSQRFSEILAQGLAEPRFRAMMSLRSDFLGGLHNDEPLFAARRQIDLPPLRLAELRKVVRRPAELLAAKFETKDLADSIAKRAADESTKDAGALPLLSYLLDDMWSSMVEKGDGVLRLPYRVIDLGRVLVERADAFLASHPNSQDKLRRVLTLKLATVREGEEPTRRRACRSEFSDEEWGLINELANHPYRLLVTARPESGEIDAHGESKALEPTVPARPQANETYAEVAHEALFRGWTKLREWIAAEREFLAWKSGLEAARQTWQATPEDAKKDALLMGAALTKAETWLAKRQDDLTVLDRDFIEQSSERERKARHRVRRAQGLAYAGLLVIIVGLVGWIDEAYFVDQWHWWTAERPYMLKEFQPYVLTPERERALIAALGRSPKPMQSFRECAKDCPEMVIVPAGAFAMGSPPSEIGRNPDESPRHQVTISKPFAVGEFTVTFDEWNACVRFDGCPQVSDAKWGYGKQPVINVTWDQAEHYAAWLSKMTGKAYHLLSESEWEYAARAGTTTAYYWGDKIGSDNADCKTCGSPFDNIKPAPVDWSKFKPNKFDLFDMAGNVWQWVEDCYHANYGGAPTDGSAWITQSCAFRILRGGSWDNDPSYLRSAERLRRDIGSGGISVGFRVARTLGP